MGKSIPCFCMEVYVKGYPWRIWLIISGALLEWWSVIKDLLPTRHKRVNRPWTGARDNQQLSGRWCPSVWMSFLPRSLQRVTTLPISESAIPNNSKVGNQALSCQHSLCFGSHFDVIFCVCIYCLLTFLSSQHHHQ